MSEVEMSAWEARFHAVRTLAKRTPPPDGEVHCASAGCGNEKLNRTDLNCWKCGGDTFKIVSAELWQRRVPPPLPNRKRTKFAAPPATTLTAGLPGATTQAAPPQSQPFAYTFPNIFSLGGWGGLAAPSREATEKRESYERFLRGGSVIKPPDPKSDPVITGIDHATRTVTIGVPPIVLDTFTYGVTR